MIALLRAGALLINVAVFAGMPLLLGASPGVAGAIAAALFALSVWGCRRSPPAEEAPKELRDAARLLADGMGLAPPTYVRMLPGWTSAVVATGLRGYGLLLGQGVEARHHAAVLAHELAHVALGDLRWEPFTDGPLRLLIGLARRVPLFYAIVSPFSLAGIPLARATELAADGLAARHIPTYPVVLKEVASLLPRPESLLYPSLSRRIRHAARHSMQGYGKGQ